MNLHDAKSQSMNSYDNAKFKISAGRIRPFALALLIIALGLLFDKWWWQIGIVIIVVLFIEAYFRYRTRD